MASSSCLSKNLHISDHTEATLHQLNEFRSSKHLCDVTVVVQGREFPAHRAVLAAGGGLFNGLFAAKMREQSENIVNLNEVDPEIAEHLLKYIYTGDIELTKDNALSIVKAADFLLLEKLKGPVDEFLAEVAKDISDDYLGNYQLAIRYKCPLFEEAMFQLVCQHFATITESQSFLELSPELLQEIINYDDLLVTSEDIVFHSLVKWVKHSASAREDSFKQLFSCVRLCSLSEEFLQIIVITEPLVLSNTECLGHVIESMRSKYLPTLAHGQHPRRCLDLYTSAVLVMPNENNLTRAPWCYIPSQDKWYQMPLKVDNTNSGHGQAVIHNGSILLVKSDIIYSNEYLVIDCYDPQTNTWSQTISINIHTIPHTNNYSVGCLKGVIYLIGGESIAEDDLSNDVYACDITDVSKPTLTAAPSMAHRRNDAGVVSDANHLYVLGGENINVDTDKQVYLNSVEMYDPEIKTWKFLSPMNNKSSLLQCTLAHGKIFVSPGLMNSNHFRNFDEVYDIVSDTWSEIPRSPRRFAMAAMSECDGKIYLIGNACPALNYVEDNSKDHDYGKLYTTSFDLKKKAWSPVVTISLKTNFAYLSGITVRLPKNNIAALQPLQDMNQ